MNEYDISCSQSISLAIGSDHALFMLSGDRNQHYLGNIRWDTCYIPVEVNKRIDCYAYIRSVTEWTYSTTMIYVLHESNTRGEEGDKSCVGKSCRHGAIRWFEVAPGPPPIIT